MHYGGVRSPDSEIVFRVGESLTERGSFKVAEDLSSWREFGVAPGRDGSLYAIFGPGQPLFSVPLIRLAQWIIRSGWYGSTAVSIPRSAYHPYAITDQKLQDPGPHLLRFIVTELYAVISALNVLLFWFILQRLLQSPLVSYIVTALYALGTLALPYAGTYFTEPLTTLFVLLAFYLLLLVDHRIQGSSGTGTYWKLAFAGLSLGSAAVVHITAVLFCPFFSSTVGCSYTGGRIITGKLVCRSAFLLRDFSSSACCWAIIIMPALGIFLKRAGPLIPKRRFNSATDHLCSPGRDCMDSC